MHKEIRQRICLLDYPPGTRLSEVELAKEFDTSRSPLRRVLARLEDEGLVQSVHGVGTYVTDADIDELEQAYRLRVELVALTGHLDPVPPDTAFLEQLDDLITRSAEMVIYGTPRSFTQLDMDVFQALLALTSNKPLRGVLERLYYQTKRIWLKTAIATRLDLNEEYRIFHRELVDINQALKIGDLEAVALFQRAHISMSFNRLARQNE
jgi:DNA-binding GntR family transcriptional regulator